MENTGGTREALEGKIKRIKQMTACEGDKGKTRMTSKVFSFVAYAAKNSECGKWTVSKNSNLRAVQSSLSHHRGTLNLPSLF